MRSGRLLGPCDAYVKDGYIVTGDRGLLDNALDPLESGLLLVEEFARLDLSDVPALVDWVRRRGPFDFNEERIGHNARNIKKPNLIRIERPDKPVEFGPDPYGPREPDEMVVARRRVAWLRDRGWGFDSVDKVRVHQEQIRNWMPALVDWVGEADSWVIGAYPPTSSLTPSRSLSMTFLESTRRIRPLLLTTFFASDSLPLRLIPRSRGDAIERHCWYSSRPAARIHVAPSGAASAQECCLDTTVSPNAAR